MSYAIYFKPQSMSAKQFDKIHENLKIEGERDPEGRLFHAGFGDKSGLHVFDVWDTLENFSKFGEKLMPVLKKAGVDPGQPEINEIYYMNNNNEKNLAVAKSMYDSFNERRFNHALKNVSDDVIIHNIAQNIQIYGKEGFLGFMNFWITAFPDAKVEIKSINPSGEKVITEFTGRGTHDGMLETPMGKVGPTGKKINISFCEIFHFNNRKIVESHLYFDLATMMQQLELTGEKVLSGL
jgi:steroid delta-isomerase-like uncharacterized protein